ncbi:MAG: hypothetical protein JWR01_1377 [Subtercola sp.]|nr:hypothetical protein [Subtercola sp.]
MRRKSRFTAAATAGLLLVVAMSLSQTARADSAADDSVVPSSGQQLPTGARPTQVPAPRQPSDDPVNGTWQNDFMAAADAIRQAYPDDLAEVVVGQDLNSGTVSFAGAAPVEALEQLGMLGGVRVVENLGYTEKSVSDAAAQVYSLAKAALGPDADVNTYYDGADGNFHVKYSASVPPDGGSDARLQQSISAQLVLPGDKRLVVSNNGTVPTSVF